MKIVTGGDQCDVRIELPDRLGKILSVYPDDLFITGAAGERHIQGEAFPGAMTDIRAAPGAGIVGILMSAEIEDAGVI